MLHKYNEIKHRKSITNEVALLSGEESIYNINTKYIYENEIIDGELIFTNFRLIFKISLDFLKREFILPDYFQIPYIFIIKFNIFNIVSVLKKIMI